jgi:putative phosphoribosyl transferase
MMKEEGVPLNQEEQTMRPVQIHHMPSLQEKTGVFADRAEGGVRLAELLGKVNLTRPLVLAIPAGGVPVAANLADVLGAPLDIVVVSKITLPWNSEAGYGAVAFDGSCRLNQDLVLRAGLDEATVSAGISATLDKVKRRQRLFRRDSPLLQLAGRDVIVVDDGLASGYTLQVAVAALRRSGADRLLLAVPTAHTAAARQLAGEVEALYCANLRSGWSYSVAAAYRSWHDVTEAEAKLMLVQYCQPNQASHARTH